MADRSTKVTLTAQVQGYLDGMEKAAKATRDTGSEAEKLAQKQQAFEALGRGALVAGGAVAAGLALSAKAAIDWESAWAGVTKTVDGSDAEMAELEQSLRGLTGVLPATHAEIAAVAEAAGQLGIERENVAAFTRTMIDLGETTNLSSEQAATSLARFTNIMGTSQSEVSNLGSALVDLGNNYATTEAEIMEMSMRLAGAGKQIGMSEGEVLGLSAALSSVGIEAEAGGSAMSKVMIDIASSVEKGGDRLATFAKVSGVSADTFASKWKTDPGAALAMFVEGLSNAEAQGTSTLGVLEDLGITEVRMRDALLRSASASDEFSAAMAKGNEAFDENNALTAEAEKRYQTTAAQLMMMKNSIVDTAISFGDAFLPAIQAAADGISEFSDFIGGLPDPLIAVIGWIGALGAAALIGGGVMLTAVPKIATYKLALETLGVSSTRTMRTLQLLGRAGAAVGGLAALSFGIEAGANALTEKMMPAAEETTNKVVTATSAVEAFAGVLEARMPGTGDKMSLAKEQVQGLAAALEDSASSTFWDKSSIGSDELLASWRLIGKELATTDFASAAEQFKVVAEGANLTRDQMSQLIEESDEFKASLVTQATAMGMSDDAATLLKLALGELGPATEDSGDAAQTSAEQYVEATDAANALASELMTLLDSYNELNGIGQNAEQTNASLQSSFAGLQEYVANAQAGLEGYSMGLDESTAAGSANRAMLADHAGSVLANAQAQFELESATLGSEQAAKNYEQRLATGRQQIYDTALALTGNADAAQKLTDKILTMPSEKEVQILMETATAQRNLDNFITLNSGKTIRIAAGLGGSGGEVQANGGIYDNKIKTFAAGGFEPGIYPYQPAGIHKFAEEYSEAYISMDPARHTRSVGVWQEAGRRLGQGGGGGVGGQSSGPVVVSLAGATLRATIDGRPITLMIQEQIASADRAGGTTVASGIGRDY